MTVSTAADHEEPTALDPRECAHPDPEGEIATAINGAVEVEAFCPDCESAFYTYIELAGMRRTDHHGWS